MECKHPYARDMRRFVCAFRLRTYGVRSVNPALWSYAVANGQEPNMTMGLTKVGPICDQPSHILSS